jgi:ketosteroid isomerase-like protein
VTGTPKPLKAWLKDFSSAVRNRDIASGKRLFDEEVVSFGTACFRAENLDELVSRQWDIVWPGTRDFDFHYDSIRSVVNGKTAAIITDWESKGANGRQRAVLRSGRATIVLQKSKAGWKAVHTHFSINPSQHDPVLRKRES